ncbi:MAG TPA: glycosyltransferase [bacterium]|nr:glycosyltransferase [bacterium]HPN31751.1 glycosyltransferase [bacterium]
MRIAFFNPQGNFDKNDSHITEHPDFGGQLVYVKQLAIALSELGHNIDIFTRKIVDADWPEFAADVEYFNDNRKVKIIRLPFSTLKFLPKEEIWNYLNSEYVPLIIDYYKKNNYFPDAGSGHYADGGFSAACFKKLTGLKYTFTAHSLGAQKMDKLNLNAGNAEELENKYKFSKRAVAERISIRNASTIVTSTQNERFIQYAHRIYGGSADVLDNMKFSVIQPGISLNIFDKFSVAANESQIVDHLKKSISRDISEQRRELPYLIVSARIDPKKNHIGLLKMFSLNTDLQEKCNLMFITRNHNNPFRDFKNLNQGFEKEIIGNMVEIINERGLNGKITMLSLSGQEELAAAYRHLRNYKSLFVLPALFEPFGLAPIEAMASGLPVVVTKFGGPSESLNRENIEFGKLIDPENFIEFAAAILDLVSNGKVWEYFSELGYNYVKNCFSWEIPSLKYEDVFMRIISDNHYDSNSAISDEEFKIVNNSKDENLGLEILNRLYFNF